VLFARRPKKGEQKSDKNTIALCPACVGTHAQESAEHKCFRCGDPRKLYLGHSECNWQKFDRRYLCPRCKTGYTLTRTAYLPVDRIVVSEDWQIWGKPGGPQTKKKSDKKEDKKKGEKDEKKWKHPLEKYLRPPGKDDKAEEWPTPAEVNRYLDVEALLLQQASLYTDAANYALELYWSLDPARGQPLLRQDPVVVREEEEWVPGRARNRLTQKLPEYKQPYIYGDLGKQFPTLPGESRTCLTRRCWKTYSKHRYDVIVKNTKFSRVAYPFPILVRADKWELLYVRQPDGTDQPCIRTTLGGCRLDLYLSNSQRHYSRQLDYLAKVIEGQGRLGDLTLLFKDTGKKTKWHQRIRIGSGWHRSFRRLDAGISVTFLTAPENRVNPKRVLYVRTDENALLTVICDKDTVHVCNYPHVVARILRHRERLRLYSEDRKFSRSRFRRRSYKKMKDECGKYRNWLECQVRDLSCRIYADAARKQAGKIVFNLGSNRFNHFPWKRLQDAVAGKCQENGVLFERQTLEELPESDTTDNQVYDTPEKEVQRARAKNELKDYQRRQNQANQTELRAARRGERRAQQDQDALTAVASHE
jgi:hypothetical protein